jgi:hypothetical protein
MDKNDISYTSAIHILAINKNNNNEIFYIAYESAIFFIFCDIVQNSHDLSML